MIANLLEQAATNMDWQQVVLNGGPPCFHLEKECFCGRAQRWDGHIVTTDGPVAHKFVSLAVLLTRIQAEGFDKAVQMYLDPHSPNSQSVIERWLLAYQAGEAKVGDCKGIMENIKRAVQAEARLEEANWWDTFHPVKDRQERIALLYQAAHSAPAPQTSARSVCDAPNEDGSYRCNKEPHTSGDHVHSFINPDGQRDIYWWPAHLTKETQP